MPDYKQGKIYLIGSPNTKQVYIGSTTHTLKSRFSGHCAKHKECESRQIIEKEKAFIELVEDYPCSDEEELLAREQHWIDYYGNRCVNKQLAIKGYKRLEYMKANSHRFFDSAIENLEARLKKKEEKQIREAKQEEMIKALKLKHRQKQQAYRQSLKSIADFVNLLNSL